MQYHLFLMLEELLCTFSCLLLAVSLFSGWCLIHSHGHTQVSLKPSLPCTLNIAYYFPSTVVKSTMLYAFTALKARGQEGRYQQGRLLLGTLREHLLEVLLWTSGDRGQSLELLGMEIKHCQHCLHLYTTFSLCVCVLPFFLWHKSYWI